MLPTNLYITEVFDKPEKLIEMCYDITRYILLFTFGSFLSLNTESLFDKGHASTDHTRSISVIELKKYFFEFGFSILNNNRRYKISKYVLIYKFVNNTTKFSKR